MKKNCRVWKREQNQGNQKKEENKNTTTPVTCSDEDVVVVIDIVASYHATPNRELFSTYKVEYFRCVKMGNTANSNIMGIEDICLQTNVG